MSTLRIIIQASLVGVLAFAAPSAMACDNGERIQIQDAMNQLVTRNAWQGVERKYSELLGTKCEIEAKYHNYGAQAAKTLGKTFEMFERLTAANESDPNDELKQNIAGIVANYGRVRIVGSARKRAALTPAAMPFAPDQRKSVGYAQSVMEGVGSFRGMLPAGTYDVGGQAFTVEAGGDDFQVVTVGKAKDTGDKGSSGSSNFSDAGTVPWSGPIVAIGFGGMQSGNPSSKARLDPDITLQGADFVAGGTCRDPEEFLVDGRSPRLQNGDGPAADQSCAGTRWSPTKFGDLMPSITVGYELGLTYKEPRIGAAATLTYRQSASNPVRQFVLAVTPVVRPGMFRFTAGPTYGLVQASGEGWQDWVDRGQDTVTAVDINTDDALAPYKAYQGFGIGGGLTASAGLAPVPVGPFMGTIEIQANWMHDGARSYSAAEIRVGIVPDLKRFED